MQRKSVIKSLHEADRLNWEGLSFPFQPYYANANQLRQAAAVLVVSIQLNRTRTPLPGSLDHSPYANTNVIIFLVNVIILLISLPDIVF